MNRACGTAAAQLLRMKRGKKSLPVLALVAANMVPLGGVLFLGWDAAVIVLLYWAENVVVGLFNVLKMALAKGKSPFFHLGKLFMIPFFCLHFGGFCVIHGLFLLVLFNLGGGLESFLPENVWPGPLVFLQLAASVASSVWRSRPEGMEWPVIFLFVSHGISFLDDSLWKKANAGSTMAKLMSQPYTRIAILQVAIIAGGVPIMLLGSPVPLLCALVLVKTSVDVYLHLKEHGMGTDDTVEPTRAWASD